MVKKDSFFVRVKDAEGYDRLMFLYGKVKERMLKDGIEISSRFGTLMYLCSYYLRHRK